MAVETEIKINKKSDGQHDPGIHAAPHIIPAMIGPSSHILPQISL
jgi:hypothetical protein